MITEIYPHFACQAMHPMSGLYLPRGVAHYNFIRGCLPSSPVTPGVCSLLSLLYKLLYRLVEAHVCSLETALNMAPSYSEIKIRLSEPNDIT